LPSNGKEITKILISGGGAKLKGIAPFLEEQLKIPVEVGNPWTNILPENIQPKKNSLVSDKEESLGFTTALGLALRGIKK
jgi:type IV pilus assembly protein PilM